MGLRLHVFAAFMLARAPFELVRELKIAPKAPRADRGNEVASGGTVACNRNGPGRPPRRKTSYLLALDTVFFLQPYKIAITSRQWRTRWLRLKGCSRSYFVAVGSRAQIHVASLEKNPLFHVCRLPPPIKGVCLKAKTVFFNLPEKIEHATPAATCCKSDGTRGASYPNHHALQWKNGFSK